MSSQQKLNPFQDLTVEIDGQPHRLFNESGTPQLYDPGAANKHPDHFNVRQYLPTGEFATLKAADELYTGVRLRIMTEGVADGKQDMADYLQEAWHSASLSDRLTAAFTGKLPEPTQKDESAVENRKICDAYGLDYP